MNAMKRRGACIVLGTTFVLSAMTALAQNDDSGMLEEITVTAERRSENLQQVPLSVTAITPDTIAAMGVRNTQDLQNIVPGLTIRSSSIGQNNFSIRGIGEANDDVSTDSGVGVYVDDIYMARTSAANLSLYDLERVEVLRGPQGTLYGRNTAGGSINIITAKPGNEFEGRLGLEVGSEGRLNASAYFSGPLVEDELFAKVSVASLNRDGIMTNRFDGVRGNEIDTLTGRLGIRYLPTENTEFLLTLDSEESTPGPNLFSLGPSDGFMNFATISGPLPASDPVRSANVNTSLSEEFKTTGVMARLNVYFDAASLSLIGGHRESDTYYSSDFDQSPEDHINEVHDENGEWSSLELRLSSASGGGDRDAGRLSWTAGLYYFEESSDKSISFNSTTIPFVFCNFVLPPFVCAGVPPGTPVDIRYSQEIETTAAAVFGQLSYAFGDRLSLIAGLRYTDEDKDFRALGSVDGPLQPPFNPLLTENIDCLGTKEFTNVSGKLALEFAVSDETLIYGSFSQGYRSGGYNGQAFDNAEACGGFDEETADSYELGLKADWADNRVRTNVSLFWTDYEDLQVSVVPMPSSTPTTTNAADAEINGAEFEFDAYLTERLSVSGNLAVLDATFRDFLTYEQGVLVDKSGERIARVPDTTWNLGLRYAFPTGNGGEVELRGDYVWEDETRVFGVLLPQWETANFRLGYVPASGKWDISAWVRNAFDELYWTATGVADTADINAVPRLLSEPRTYGLTFNYHMGQH